MINSVQLNTQSVISVQHYWPTTKMSNRELHSFILKIFYREKLKEDASLGFVLYHCINALLNACNTRHKLYQLKFSLFLAGHVQLSILQYKLLWKNYELLCAIT